MDDHHDRFSISEALSFTEAALEPLVDHRDPRLAKTGTFPPGAINKPSEDDQAAAVRFGSVASFEGRICGV